MLWYGTIQMSYSYVSSQEFASIHIFKWAQLLIWYKKSNDIIFLNILVNIESSNI